MDRKYQKVEMGVGAFHHPPKAKYSEETKNMMKILMDEAKVSMSRRKAIQQTIEKGEPLPPISDKSKMETNKSTQYQVLMPTVWKRRTKDMIIQSGAYEREQFRRTSPLRNKEKQKRHLAYMMAYGKDMPETPREPRTLHKARRKPRCSDDGDPIDDLTRGIKERLEFLSDMECLGLGKKYRPIIQQEVAHKLRLIESVDKQRSKELRKEIGELERPPPKPLPTGLID